MKIMTQFDTARGVFEKKICSGSYSPIGLYIVGLLSSYLGV